MGGWWDFIVFIPLAVKDGWFSLLHYAAFTLLTHGSLCIAFKLFNLLFPSSTVLTFLNCRSFGVISPKMFLSLGSAAFSCLTRRSHHIVTPADDQLLDCCFFMDDANMP